MPKVHFPSTQTSTPPPAGAPFTCEITDIGFGGDGIGHLENGTVIFVPFTAIGDTVEGTITQSSRSFCRGECNKILTPGADRIPPQCSRFGECGGCCYQHLTYSAELNAKRKQFQDLMRRIGHFENFPPLEKFEAAPFRMGYRNKLRLEPYRRPGQSGIHYGFCERDNRTFFTVQQCPLAQDAVNAQIASAKQSSLAVHNSRRRPPAAMTIRCDAEGKTAYYFDYASPKMPWLREKLLERRVAVPVGSFWQVNPPVAEKLLRTVREWLEPLSLRALVDAYGGIGTFSLAMGDLFSYRVIVESDKQAVACAEYNHREAGLKATFLSQTTESALQDVLAKVNTKETCVILDPPRTGCMPKALQALLRFPVGNVVYVSCNASTLARDLRELSAVYTPCRAACFDMFPCTAHFESAVLLTRNSPV